MPRTCDIVLGGRLMVLMKGDNGVGKTVAAGSFPGPIKYFMFDGSKLDAIKMYYPDRTDIEYDLYGPHKVRGRDPLGNPYQVKDLLEFAEEFQQLQVYCPFATVVIDSFTSFCNTCVTYQLGVRSGSDGKNPAKSKGGLIIPDFDEYKGETTLVTQTLDVSKILPCHVIWTAHPLPKLETTGSGASMRVTKSSTIASYGAKTAALAPSYFNEVWHFSVDGAVPPKRTVHTVTLGVDAAKTGLPLPAAIDFTGKRLFREIQEHLNQYQIRLSEAVASKAEQEAENARREEERRAAGV